MVAAQEALIPFSSITGHTALCLQLESVVLRAGMGGRGLYADWARQDGSNSVEDDGIHGQAELQPGQAYAEDGRRYSHQLRFESTFTNVLNHTNFAPPATQIDNTTTFGVLSAPQTAENAGNRTGQAAWRLDF